MTFNVLYLGAKIRIYEYHWLFKLPLMRNYSAITLWKYILFASYMRIPTIKHELIHIEQIAEEGLIKFYFKYIWYFVKNLFKGMGWNQAYMNIPYEKEAYENYDRIEGYKIV